ncbi:MAG TPA: DUF6455 family protein [Acetobacteraceae bacterium]|nr:DUF6455 family protein [Acetobacteraceae bacterium]
METSPAASEPGLLARAIEWIKAYNARQQELGRLSRDDIDMMASDLGMSAADLCDVLPRSADNTFLMDSMLLARGLDPDEVRRSLTPLLRDLELACTRCAATGRCKRELLAGTAAMHSHQFCPNADTIDDLLEERANT